MGKVVLCGHTGSYNHGCEAIIKSTASILYEKGILSILATHDLEADKQFGLEEFDSTVEYLNFKNSYFKRCISVFLSRIVRAKAFSNYMVQNKVWSILNGNLAINVGGDTYCYTKPYASIYLNKYCSRHKIESVLWGCSIEKDTLSDREIVADLKRYSYIFPRETMTYENLKSAGFDENKMVLMCDPAFLLEPEVVNLPKGFIEKNTVGLNFSPTIMVRNSDSTIVTKNYERVIDYVLKKTNFPIALIPHVYNGCKEDLKVLSSIYNEYKDNPRVVLCTEPYNCRQLKYIISKCRFLITARTHASIAAYSSFVPTLVLGYSIKANGIAKDIFGTCEKYVLSVQELKEETNLLKAFLYIIENEDTIKKKLVSSMPQYKSQAAIAAEAIKRIIEVKE